MKIAILYSGAIRTLAETIENNLNYFDFSEIDLYFSAWDHIGYSERINSPDYIFSKRQINATSKVSTKLISDIVDHRANIKAIKIETYNPNNYHAKLINGIDNEGLFAQYYKIWDCYQLLDQSINYDAIVRLRCDILLNNKMDQNILREEISNDQIIFSNKIWYDYCWDENKRTINEMMWISNKELMNKACNIYHNVEKINKIIKENNYQQTNHGESICFMNLQAENITSNISVFDFNYNVLR